MEKEKIDLEFQNNINYILLNLKKDIYYSNDLEDKLYFELSKSNIIKDLNYVYDNVKNWGKLYSKKQYKEIIEKYSEIESMASQLEMCLTEYDKQFYMDGISYSIFQIGKTLSVITQGNDKTERWQSNNIYIMSYVRITLMSIS